MRVLYDLRGTQSHAFPERGIPRYVSEHVSALADRSDIDELHGLVDVSRPLPAVAARIAENGGTLVTSVDVGNLVRRDDLLIHHVGSPFELDIPPDQLLPSGLRRPNVVRAMTLYDVIPLAMPDAVPDPFVTRLWSQRARLLQSADAVLAISRFSAADGTALLRLDPRRVTAIGTGIPQPPAELDERPPHPAGIAGPFVLSVGGFDDRRKNVDLVVRAFASLDQELRERHRLVVCGRQGGEGEAMMRRVAAEEGVEDRVVLTGFVPDAVLRSLYSTCACFVYPSLYEGFGLPIAEAMSYGAPVLASETTACGELVEHPAARFDPTDADELSRRLASVLGDGELRERLRHYGRRRAAAHHWEGVAERTVRAYATAARQRAFASARRAGPRAVGFASFAPAAYGAPSFSLFLLAAAVSADRPVMLGVPEPLATTVGVGRIPPERLAGALPWLDGPLVCLVDSPEAAAGAARLLEKREGVALLWEAERVGHSQEARDALARVLNAAQQVLLGNAVDAAVAEACGMTSGHEHVLIPPPLAWTVAAGRIQLDPPPALEALLTPSRREAVQSSPLQRVVVPVPARFGELTPAALELWVETAIALCSRRPDTAIHVLGTIDPQVAAGALTRAAGAGARLHFQVWPESEELAAHLTAADVIAHLGGGLSEGAAVRDLALLAGARFVGLGPGATAWGEPRLPTSAAPTEIAAAIDAAIDAGAPHAGMELERRSPERAAKTLLDVLGCGTIDWSGVPTAFARDRRAAAYR